MKALVYLGPRRMEMQDSPDPVPGPGEVVISTSASAICGSDLHGFREASPRRIPPLIMGHETVGRISAVGEGVDPAREGERVVLKPVLPCGTCEACRADRTNLCATGRLVGRDLTGGFAERFAVPASAAVQIAAQVPEELATLTEPLANALHVSTRSVRPDDTVLVIGAGPIGALMVRMALECGASVVFSSDPVSSRLAFTRAQGAETLDPQEPGADLRRHVGERGVDVVIDAAGFEATWTFGLHAVRPGGRIEAVGLGSPKGEIDYFALVGKEVTVTGSFAWADGDFARAVELIEANALDTQGWFTTMPLAEGQRAFEELVDTTDRFKVVLVP